MEGYKDCSTEGCGGKCKVTFQYCYNCNMKKKAEKPAQQTFNTANKYVPTDDTKTNSIALSYAKDLVVAGKIGLSELPKYMSIFKEAINTGNMQDIIVEEVV